MKFNEVVGFKFESGAKAFLLNLAYYPFHIHQNVLELICVLKGHIKVLVHAMEYELSAGDVFVVNPRDPHKFSAEGDNIILFLQIDLAQYSHHFPKFDLVGNSMFFCDSFHHCSNAVRDIKRLRFLITKIFQLYCSEDFSNLKMESLVKEILECLIEDFRHYGYIKTEEGGFCRIQRRKNAEWDRTNAIMEVLETHFYEKLTLEMLAKEFF